MNQNNKNNNPAQQRAEQTMQTSHGTLPSLPSPGALAQEPKAEESDSQPTKTTPALWHCDTYCRKVRYVSCEGRAYADPTSPNRCPYLDEMLY